MAIAIVGNTLNGEGGLEVLPSPRPRLPGFPKGDNLLVYPMVLFFSLRRTPYNSRVL
jgi:hypothetical protein